MAHDGGSGDGEFCQTLVLTCVATGWTEMRALRNKAQRWSFAAIVDIEATMPFPLLGLDSDNGSEFINDQLYRWCQANEVTFTRSRPYRKNDSCFVEQKNFPIVRQQVGYARYDTEAELQVLTGLDPVRWTPGSWDRSAPGRSPHWEGGPDLRTRRSSRLRPFVWLASPVRS